MLELSLSAHRLKLSVETDWLYLDISATNAVPDVVSLPSLHVLVFPMSRSKSWTGLMLNRGGVLSILGVHTRGIQTGSVGI